MDPASFGNRPDPEAEGGLLSLVPHKHAVPPPSLYSIAHSQQQELAMIRPVTKADVNTTLA